MNIAFLVRGDFFTKFGGDTLQVTQYAECMRDRGIHSNILTIDEFVELSEGKISRFDFFVIVNLDRVFELLFFWDMLLKFNLTARVLLLPIHHPKYALDDMLKLKLSYAWPLFSFLGGYLFYEKLKAVYLSLRFKSLSLVAMFILCSPLKQLHEILSVCGLICIARGELDSIEADFQVKVDRSKVVVVRNGVTAKFLSDISDAKPADIDIDILVCGRIEERKNQIGIIRALVGTSYKVGFIGALNVNNKGYVSEFLSLVAACENVTYLGVVPPDEMPSYYVAVKIVLSASFCEVSSLVDIEAYTAGRAVICSERGYSHEILNGLAVAYVDPMDLSGLPVLFQRVESELDNLGIRNVYSWEESSSDLAKFFFRVSGQEV